jgi:ATP-dependent RNA circularization protein (DNA/RNA ligase family)
MRFELHVTEAQIAAGSVERIVRHLNRQYSGHTVVIMLEDDKEQKAAKRAAENAKQMALRSALNQVDELDKAHGYGEGRNMGD